MPRSLYRISRSDDGLVVEADSIDAVLDDNAQKT